MEKVRVQKLIFYVWICPVCGVEHETMLGEDVQDELYCPECRHVFTPDVLD